MISTLMYLALAADYPSATISNGTVTADFLLPDPEKGSYHGTRFDWSGIMSRLTYRGHQYFGQWYPKHDRFLHDAITGPVEEFLSNDAGLGYADAKPGGLFVRIGVGAVRKPEEQAYRRFETYDIVDAGDRTLHRGQDWIQFDHKLYAAGYGYEYRKTIRLQKSGLTIEHVLKNTGTKPIDTVVYNHDFFSIDNQPTGPDTVVRFAWTPKPDAPFQNGGEIVGQEIHYAKELQPGETVAADLSGFGPFDFSIENKKSLAGVRVTGDKPLTQLHFWSIRTVVCPEPYVHVAVAPKGSFKWSITYLLYTLSVP
jgi:hypothetical protein